MEASEFRRLMERVAHEDREAQTQLVDHFLDELLRRIRAGLDRCAFLRTDFDPEDFAQEIWLKFFSRPARSRHFGTPALFVCFLAKVVRHVILNAARSQLDVLKRDVRRRRHLSDPQIATEAVAVPAPRPDPARIAASLEQCHEVLKSLTSQEQRIVHLLAADCTHAEIAAELDCCERTIERMVGEIRHRFQFAFSRAS
jgi:RNA polymerase sigma factor (sigma-70 family)